MVFNVNFQGGAIVKMFYNTFFINFKTQNDRELLLPQTAALPGSDAGSDVIKPASSFVIQNRQTSCSMWCPMYRARC